MEPPPAIRSYRDEEAARVAAFFSDVHAHDESVAAPSEAAWRAFAARAQNGGGHDFALAEAAGAIVGVLSSARLERARHFRIVVHPAHRRRGVARALLRVVEGQDAPSSVALEANCRGIWAAGRAFLAGEGFAVVHRDLLMHRSAADVPALAAPEGYLLRRYAGATDHPAWAELHNDGFTGAFYFAPETADSIASYTGVPGFGLWLAEHAGRAVGYCHVEHFGMADGLIHSLVVAASHRGRGVARALLLRGARELAEGGRARLELSVDSDNARALALYSGVGFAAYDEVLNHRRAAR